MDGARNMARDHAMALGLSAGAAAVRIYRWKRPTVSFGRNEPARAGRELAAARSAGVAFVRRPSGGRAVLHDQELTYAVALPARALGGARSTYQAVNAGLVDALRALGVPAELAPAAPAWRPEAGPCFEAASQGEVTVEGLKLVGSAQVRLGGVLLQHGSLLIGPGQALLGSIRHGPATSGRGSTSLLEVMGFVPDWDRLVLAVLGGLRGSLGGRWREADRGELPHEAQLLERYASEAWTWRR
jgi:lipoate-protein ligase A